MNLPPVGHSVLTPLSFLDRSREVYPNKVAIVYGEQRLTYAQFAARVNRIASALRVAGLQKGDRVAFLCPNIPPMLEAHFGVPLAGGILVSINIRLKPQEVKYILNQSQSSFLFVDTEFAETIRPILGELTTVKKIINIADINEFEPLEAEDYEAFLQSGSDQPVPWTIADEMEPISINYTSGTTGHSKGVMYSHRGAYINSLAEAIETTLTPESVYLWTLPMFHCNGWCFTWGVTAIGGTHICLRKFYPATVWRLIAQENVTHFNGAPVLLIALLNHRDRPQKLSQPLTVTTAGAPPSPTLIQHMQEIGAKIIHVYGLTEVYGPHTVCEYQTEWDKLFADEKAKKVARQGVRYIGADGLRVVDEKMNDVPRRRRNYGRSSDAGQYGDVGILQ